MSGSDSTLPRGPLSKEIVSQTGITGINPNKIFGMSAFSNIEKKEYYEEWKKSGKSLKIGLNMSKLPKRISIFGVETFDFSVRKKDNVQLKTFINYLFWAIR